MTRPILLAAALAAALAPPLAVSAASAAPAPSPDAEVAHAFMAAAKAQDRKAALELLDRQVSIRFPGEGGASGQARGQPFVIGYLDGLFDARGLSLEGAAPQGGEAARFLARDLRSNVRYAIDVEVKDHRVVRLTVNRDRPAGALAVND